MKLLPAPRLRRAAAAALVLTATAALTGCSGASPSVVAYVGGEKITQTQLEQAVDGLSTTLQEGQTVSSEAVVNAMIQGELAEQIAAEQGIALTDADREAVLAQSELAPLTKVPEAREVVNDVADSQIVAQKLGGRRLPGRAGGARRHAQPALRRPRPGAEDRRVRADGLPLGAGRPAPAP